jgi:hypothetical protein
MKANSLNVGMGAWGWELGDESIGMGSWGWDYRDWSMDNFSGCLLSNFFIK